MIMNGSVFAATFTELALPDIVGAREVCEEIPFDGAPRVEPSLPDAGNSDFRMMSTASRRAVSKLYAVGEE